MTDSSPINPAAVKRRQYLLLAGIAAAIVGAAPVSYTHLDVYKRQPSWCNCDFVTDFARSIARWWRGDVPALGHLGTTIIAHQAVAGAGYRLAR